MPDKRPAFDAQGFYEDLNRVRETRGKNWKQVAQEAGVTASTLTRMGQGSKPDLETMGSLCSWAGLSPNTYFAAAPGGERDTLAEVSAVLRADPNLSERARRAISDVIQVTYSSLRED